MWVSAATNVAKRAPAAAADLCMGFFLDVACHNRKSKRNSFRQLQLGKKGEAAAAAAAGRTFDDL